MTINLSSQSILKDYEMAWTSRWVSLIGRKEVLNGKAKFGIFGDGKEVAQVALAHVCKPGDWRSGYYRDQTLMFALGSSSPKEFFAQLYADPNIKREPASGGRQMNCHFATRYIDEDGNWRDQTQSFQSSADVSPTGGQMARLLGLAYASKLYRNVPELSPKEISAKFSKNGQEIAFGTIGNASTSEGIFWEVLNAAGVLQVPMLLSVWDDDFGISVPNHLQTTKSSISKILSGFSPDEKTKGVQILTCKGYDFEDCLKTYQHAERLCREQHIPCLVHVTHVTQPQGHSTSGSHERYKSAERLKYEDDFDGLKMMKAWILEKKISSESALEKIEINAQKNAESARLEAWRDYEELIKEERRPFLSSIDSLSQEYKGVLRESGLDFAEFGASSLVLLRDIQSAYEKFVRQCVLVPPETSSDIESSKNLQNDLNQLKTKNEERYSSHQFCIKRSPLKVVAVPALLDGGESCDGRQIIQKFFDHALKNEPRLFVVGEDIGQLGGVNLEFDGLMVRYSALRVTDTGIREASIFGQGLGAAMRGLRPVVDIQYLDYLLYCLQPMSDDLATLHYRSAGGQLAPVIVRTKGHRLEGIWHTGSPLGMILAACPGIHVCVPRNATQAVGFYQTLLEGDDPGLVIEVLNGYRLKEICPTNLGVFKLALGVPEVLRQGSDITVVTYGANVRIALSAALFLEKMGVLLEVIDVQTLAPFDVNHVIKNSLAKTHALLCFDEDVPGGATAYMLQKILEEQSGFDLLDSTPRTLCSKSHRSAYGSDGDYFSKPNIDDLIRVSCQMMSERRPPCVGETPRLRSR